MAEIVVGVDGSAHAAAALRWAARTAALAGDTLVAVLVWDLFNQRHPDGSRRFDPAYDEAAADAALALAVDDALGAAGGSLAGTVSLAGPVTVGAGVSAPSWPSSSGGAVLGVGVDEP